MRYRTIATFLFVLLLCSCNREYFNVGDRKLRIYNDLTGLPKADKVRAIKLEGQGLQSFPKELFRYKNLEYINLRNNNISSIPDSIRIFEDLYGLYLDSNPIMKLPDSIVTLKKLKGLTIIGTDISSFPEEFNKLTNLKVVLVGGVEGLKYQEIKKLEEEMPWCKFIQSVD